MAPYNIYTLAKTELNFSSVTEVIQFLTERWYPQQIKTKNTDICKKQIHNI